MPEPGCSDAEVRWSGGGDPPTGTGRRFRTVFAEGGVRTVTVRCGGAGCDLPVTVCPIDEWMVRARDELYGDAVDFSVVRVKGSGLVLGPTGTGWTCNNVIRFKRPRKAADLPQESTLIHELGHVWQHQSGQAQLLRGIVEQVAKAFGRNPYDFGGPEGVRRAARLTQFRKESQAEIIRSFWMLGHGFGSDIHGAAFTTPGYADDLRRLVEGAGIATSAGRAPSPWPGTPARRRSLVGVIDSAVAKLVNAVLR